MSTNYTNNINTLIQGVLNNGPDVLEHCVYENSPDIQKYLDRIVKEHLDYPAPKSSFDKDNWFIPQEYKELDIEVWLYEQCTSEIELKRVEQEINLFKTHSMMPVLNTMVYIVNTLRTNNVVWGVGRGSSVASYVLYLIGVHKIDSIKYSIPIEEFFKGDNNG